MKNFLLFLCVAIVAGAIIWFAKDSIMGRIGVAKDKVTAKKAVNSIEEMQTKLNEYTLRRDRIQKSLTRMKADQRANIQYLKENGIRKKVDAKGNVHAELAWKNTHSLKVSIEELESQLPTFEKTITGLKAAIAQAQRKDLKESAELTDDDLLELYQIEEKLNDDLGLDEDDIFVDSEIEDLLEAEDGTGQDDGDLDQMKIVPKVIIEQREEEAQIGPIGN